MTELGRSLFSGKPVEYAIPKTAKVVFVNDFFVKEVAGGAELTSEAIIAKSPHKVFRLHSNSITKKLLDGNKDKYWVFGNFASMPDTMMQYLPDSGIRYSIVEYDFKFCSYRSTNRHQQATGQPCTCATDRHGLVITRLFRKAERIFWMSSGQKEHWLRHVPVLLEHPGHVILSSVFDDETLDYLAELRTQKERKPEWAVLGSGSWIKGTEGTALWCRLKKMPFAVLPGMAYKEFLANLAQYQGFVFMPLDKDTCPRVTMEARLLGMNLTLNHNVLQQDDEWFRGTPEEVDAYLRSRGQFFWEQIPTL